MHNHTEEHIDDINNLDENGLDSMNKEDILSRSSELLKIISEAEAELSEVRSNCRHKDRSVKNINLKDRFALRIICDDCQLAVGYPSADQIEKWKES